MLVRRRWSMAMRLIAMIVGAVVVAGALSACDPIAPNVVGKNLPDAIHRLEISGYKQVNVVDDSGMTITTDHYEVTAQDKEGTDIPTTDTITLTVAESHVAALVSTPHPHLRKQQPHPSPHRLRWSPNLSLSRNLPWRSPSPSPSPTNPLPLRPRLRPRPRDRSRAAPRLERLEQPPSIGETPATAHVWTATRTAWPASSGPARYFRPRRHPVRVTSPRPRLHEAGASSCATAWPWVRGHRPA